jgi:hypothetical protein
MIMEILTKKESYEDEESHEDETSGSEYMVNIGVPFYKYAPSNENANSINPNVIG